MPPGSGGGSIRHHGLVMKARKQVKVPRFRQPGNNRPDAGKMLGFRSRRVKLQREAAALSPVRMQIRSSVTPATVVAYTRRT